MRFAIRHGDVIKPTPGVRGICPTCEGSVRAFCGQQQHFRHVPAMPECPMSVATEDESEDDDCAFRLLSPTDVHLAIASGQAVCSDPEMSSELPLNEWGDGVFDRAYLMVCGQPVTTLNTEVQRDAALAWLLDTGVIERQTANDVRRDPVNGKLTTRI